MAATKLESHILIQKLEEIPSLPTVLYELTRTVNDPMSSVYDIEKVMSQDIGMTTKVLKLASSSYYAVPGGVSSLTRAISQIGLNTIHQLVLASSVIKSVKPNAQTEFDINEFWKHSFGTAIAAECIATFRGKDDCPDIFTCGLLHDIGKMALYLIAPTDLDLILESTQNRKLSFLKAEHAIGLLPHTQLGQELCQKWKLPDVIGMSSRYHHEFDFNKRSGVTADIHPTIDIVALANLLIHALKFGNSGHSDIVGAPVDLLERLMINPKSDMPKLLDQIKKGIDNASDIFQMLTNS
jgi:HD-like signal output (HDOD) protein